GCGARHSSGCCSDSGGRWCSCSGGRWSHSNSGCGGSCSCSYRCGHGNTNDGGRTEYCDSDASYSDADLGKRVAGEQAHGKQDRITCMIMQKNGAGLHTASSCYWNNETDGSCTVRWENKTMYCIVEGQLLR
uniref:Uncharacterized protein n=1 Tax=Anopheles maculatus TaxID=74869 RepID=A0A182T746_9DIPT